MSKFNFELKNKKFKFLGFHVVVGTREDLSIDVSITNVVLILTKLRLFQLFSTSQNSILNLKKFKFWGFHVVVGTRKALSIDVSITNVVLILTKLRWFQLFGTNQNSISNFFKKEKSNFLGFHDVVLVKTFLLMHQLLR